MNPISPGDPIEIKLTNELTIKTICLTAGQQRKIAVAEDNLDAVEKAAERFDIIENELLPACLPDWEKEQVSELFNEKVNLDQVGIIARSAMGRLTAEEKKRYESEPA